MKLTIGQYEVWLENYKTNLERRTAALKRDAKDIQIIKQDIRLRERQIEEAKKRGKDGFDSERFLVKRGKNEHNEG